MKKYIFTIITLFVFVAIGNTQTPPINMSDGGSDSTCETDFYDPGGTGNYTNIPTAANSSDTITHTICNPTAGESIWAVFEEFDLYDNTCAWSENMDDQLRIFDGQYAIEANLIGSFSGTDLQPGSAQAIIEGTTGCLTFQFVTMNYTGLGCGTNQGAPGWLADITCEEPPTPQTGELCFEAIPFCSDIAYDFPNASGGSTTAPTGPDYGCLGSEPNPIWYFLQIGQTGDMQLSLSQTNTNGTGIDIDFAMWGPFTNTFSGCNQVMAGVPPIQCSYSASSSETIGLGMQGGFGSGQSTPPTPQAGEVYIIVMTNFNGSAGNISLSQSGGTGATDCSILVPCNITSVTDSIIPCNDSTNLYSITGEVIFEDQPDGGFLVVKTCDGDSVILSPPFVSPMAYTIDSIEAVVPTGSSDCAITAYFTDEPLCSATSATYQKPMPCVCIPPALTIDTVNICEGANYNLNGAIDASSDPATKTYYANQTDAQNGTNPINSIISTEGTYWVRAEVPNWSDCFEVYEIIVNTTEVTYTAVTTVEHCDLGNGSIVLTASNGMGPYTYSIDNGATTQASNTFSNLSAGIYNVLITDVNGCDVTGIDTIVEIAGPTLDDVTAIDPSCFGLCDGELEAITSGGTAPFTYAWTDANNTAVGSGTSQIANLCEGTYQVVITDDNNCSVSQSGIILTEPAEVVVTAPNDTIICEQQPIVLTATAPNGATVTWDNNVTNNLPFYPDSVGATTYTVTADVNGCIGTDEVIVTVRETPVPEFTTVDLEGCKPHTVVFESTNNIPGSTCVWDFGNGQTGTGCSSVTHNYTMSGQYTVSLSVSSPEGCTGTTTKVDYINVKEMPVAEFEAIPMIANISDPDVTFINHSKSGVKYVWNFGDNSPLDTTLNPVHTFPHEEPGEYVVTLIVTGGDGCVDTINTLIKVQDILLYYIPNTFTPDENGYNEVFLPIFTAGYDPQDFNMYIYNRWGEILFESHDATVGWNGTYGGKIVPDGVYMWKIEFKETMTDQRHIKTGYVNLIR